MRLTAADGTGRIADPRPPVRPRAAGGAWWAPGVRPAEPDGPAARRAHAQRWTTCAEALPAGQARTAPGVPSSTTQLVSVDAGAAVSAAEATTR